MGDVISISDYTPLDQILKSGDIVRITNNEDPDIVDLVGIVLDIERVYGPDTDAPGQAAIFAVGVPLEDEWIIVEDIEISEVVRVVGLESKTIKRNRVQN